MTEPVKLQAWCLVFLPVYVGMFVLVLMAAFWATVYAVVRIIMSDGGE